MPKTRRSRSHVIAAATAPTAMLVGSSAKLTDSRRTQTSRRNNVLALVQRAVPVAHPPRKYRVQPIALLRRQRATLPVRRLDDRSAAGILKAVGLHSQLSRIRVVDCRWFALPDAAKFGRVHFQNALNTAPAGRAGAREFEHTRPANSPSATPIACCRRPDRRCRRPMNRIDHRSACPWSTTRSRPRRA